MAHVQAPSEPLLKAPKDRTCKYCGQTFTSSSLGRHLDLYIKEKNPKPDDGIHDVEEIRRLRNTITRRTPKMVSKRDSVVSANYGDASRTPGPLETEDMSDSTSPTQTRDANGSTDMARMPSIDGRWDVAIMANDADDAAASDTKMADGNDGNAADARLRAHAHRVASRHQQKSNLDTKQKIHDLYIERKAADLALRELVSSLRAAKQKVDLKTMPFDFDPMTMDFPTLVLQCLSSPSTLFSPTQLTTPTSWSISPPGEEQRDALIAHFAEAFGKFKVTCATATRAVMEETSYPQTHSAAFKEANKAAIHQASADAEAMEARAMAHLEGTFNVWRQIPLQKRSEIWLLELARGVGRRDQQVEKLKQEIFALKQENAHLTGRLEQRETQPQELKITAPTHFPIEEKVIQMWCKDVLDNPRAIALGPEYRHLDLSNVVSAMVDKWKTAIVTSRAQSGMSSQKPLGNPSPSSSTGAAPLPSASSVAPSTVELSSPEQTHRSQFAAPTETSETPHIRAPPSDVPVRSTESIVPQFRETTPGPIITNPQVIPLVDDGGDMDADGEMQLDEAADGTSALPNTETFRQFARADRFLPGGVAKAPRMKHPDVYKKSLAKANAASAAALAANHDTNEAYRRASLNFEPSAVRYIHQQHQPQQQQQQYAKQQAPQALGMLTQHQVYTAQQPSFSPELMIDQQQMTMQHQNVAHAFGSLDIAQALHSANGMFMGE